MNGVLTSLTVPFVALQQHGASAILRLLLWLLGKDHPATILLTKLEALFESWKAGTLIIPEPRPVTPAPAPKPRQKSRSRYNYARRRTTAAREQPREAHQKSTLIKTAYVPWSLTESPVLVTFVSKTRI